MSPLRGSNVVHTKLSYALNIILENESTHVNDYKTLGVTVLLFSIFVFLIKTNVSLCCLLYGKICDLSKQWKNNTERARYVTFLGNTGALLHYVRLTETHGNAHLCTGATLLKMEALVA